MPNLSVVQAEKNQDVRKATGNEAMVLRTNIPTSRLRIQGYRPSECP